MPDRPPPLIKDPTVLGVFKNATDVPVIVELRTAANVVFEEFRLEPQAVEIEPIQEGRVTIHSLKAPTSLPLQKREPDKSIAEAAIKFRELLSADYGTFTGVVRQTTNLLQD